jgi:hypothetical protein
MPLSPKVLEALPHEKARDNGKRLIFRSVRYPCDIERGRLLLIVFATARVLQAPEQSMRFDRAESSCLLLRTGASGFPSSRS